MKALTELPPVLLLWGPASVGKRTICEQWLQEASEADVLRVDVLDALTAREVVKFCATHPMGPMKWVFIRLDGAKSSIALNVLLKVLEEPPSYMRFLLTTTSSPLATIASRAQVYRVGYLRIEDVEHILEEQGHPVSEAKLMAKVSGGQMSRAQDAGDVLSAKGPVLAVVRAAAEADPDLLMASVSRFTEKHLELLRRWVVEARTGRWQVFSPEESSGLNYVSHATMKRLESVLRLGARPRLIARVGFMPLAMRTGGEE